MWRVDHVHRIAVEPVCPDGCLTTTWHDHEDDALAEASRLRFAGYEHVIAWRDWVAA
jgi:hypothetical protein